MEYDVVVAGGSIAGLLCAREIALRGRSVAVLEEDHEIGTPEHCGGLASLSGLDRLGLDPGAAHAIDSAELVSPGGRRLVVGAKRQGVVSIDRRGLDKQAALQAGRAGAAIMTGTSFRGMKDGAARTSAGVISCGILVDARGAGALAQADRSGMIPSAQYEVCAGWIRDGTVEVLVDPERYPGFFAWVIPAGGGRGRVGAAGRGIAAARAADGLVRERGGGTVLRRIFAPVWTGGPADSFVGGATVTVGDAAGQAKPTTGGGIYTCGMGGVLAGRAVADRLESGDPDALRGYQRAWEGMFGAEFAAQLRARRILERLDGRAVDGLFGAVTPEAVSEASGRGDFDLHAASIARLLGLRGAAAAAGAVAGSEARRLLGRAGKV